MAIVQTVPPEQATGKVAQVYAQLEQPGLNRVSAGFALASNTGLDDRDIIDGLFQGARKVAVDILFDTFKVENVS